MTLPAVPPAAPFPPPAPAGPRLPEDAYRGGLAFHRLLFARRRSGWWTPLAVGGLGVAFYAAGLAVLLLPLIVAVLLDPGSASSILTLDSAAVFDLAEPLTLVVGLGSIALMLPAYLLASLVVSGPRVGLISSAFGRLRWRFLVVCGAVAVAVFTVATALSWLLPAGEDAGADGVVRPAENPMLWASLVAILVLVPVQAAAEEYVFRGYLMQSIGRWLRHPAFAILLPVPLFVFGHLYDPLGLVSVGVFAVAAGSLTWRTGGLEAAIAVHVVNNLSAFLLALAGLADINSASPGLAGFVFSVAVVLAFTGAVELLLRRRPLPRTLVITPAPPSAPDDSAL